MWDPPNFGPRNGNENVIYAKKADHHRPRHKYPEKCSKNLSGNSQIFP